MTNKLFLNSDLCRNWNSHRNYFKTIVKLRECKEMVEKEQAVIGMEAKKLYILSINLTPYFYLNESARNTDYKNVLILIGKLQKTS